MSAQASCPACGAARAPEDRFCGSCGAVLGAAPSPAAAGPTAKKTMLGISPSAMAAQAQAQQVRPSAPDPAQRPKTMLGMMAPMLANPGAEPAPNREAPPQPVQAPAAHPRVEPAPGPPKPDVKKTMLGMSPLAGAGAARPLDAPAPQQEVAPPSKPVPVLDPRSKHTMLGAAPPGLMQVAAPQSAVPTPAVVSTPEVVPAASPTTRESTEAAPSFSTAPARPSLDDLEAPIVVPGASSARSVWIIAGLVVLVLIGVVGVWLGAGGPDIAVRVVTTEAGDALEVQVPASPAGSKVRFSGTELPLEAGRALFPLRVDDLAVGDNELAIGVVSADGSVDTATVALHLDYRVRLDVAALAENPPAVDLVVDVKPGARVTLDGAPLQLDARGHASKRYVVPPQQGSTYTLAVRYRIEGEATPTEGTARLSLPVTRMELDKPGPEVTTDQEQVELAGAVEAGASVHVDGTALEVRDGRFLRSLSLPKPGTQRFQVIARAPGKAPKQVDVQVQRVEDMALAAATFEADKSLTYARLATNPVVYRGQKVAFDGRVYNVEMQGGQSVLQMFALDCPGKQRCLLWVEYGQATDAAVDTWVRVLGTVEGEQQFRSKQGQVQTVPSVKAQYVLRLAR